MTAISKIRAYLFSPVSIAPLIVFRIAFGLLMFLSVSRFIAKGWVHSMYIAPKMFFPYYGFEWVKPLPGEWMYAVFALLLLASLGVLFGALYRFSAAAFFFLFTYVELIDKTNYLNHYYFVSLVSFILIFLPAAERFSVDVVRSKSPRSTHIPRLYLLTLQLQMFIVYFFAGIAKLNYDWLFEAQPLKLWLPAFSHYPLIGNFMEADWVAYLFAWFACIYDLSIGFLLFNRKTVNIAYLFVVLFHLATAIFFNIGMFPYIMMTITIVFFREEYHERALVFLRRLFSKPGPRGSEATAAVPGNAFRIVYTVFFALQIILPFRYLFYSGKLFWTEQGYRFSWRVMLMEKAGTAFFFVRDGNSGREVEVDNKKYLTYMQEKMMATQPDMMVDYAKFLKEEFSRKGFKDPTVRAESFVTLNGCGSRPFIDPSVDLSSLSNSFFSDKTWVKSY